MIRKILSALLIVVSAFAFLAFCRVLDCTRQTTETDVNTEIESTTVGTTEAVVWLYFPDLSERPHESIVLTGDDLGEALRYLNGIEFKDAYSQPEEPMTEMYVAVDADRGYTVTYIVDSFGQVWLYIDEDYLGVGVHQRGARMKGGE